MAQLKSSDLQKIYNNFVTIRNSLEWVKSHVITRKRIDFLSQIGYPYLGEKKFEKERERFLNEDFKDIEQYIDENGALALIAEFERQIFLKLPTAFGELKKIVRQEYTLPWPFFKNSENFIKTGQDLNKLSHIEFIISNHIQTENKNKFLEIVSHRNWIAHGKRFGSKSSLNVDEIAECLDTILSSIQD